ncbi:MAG: family 43 glycosylhydrolase, partial [Muribaculaceae bacterium]|nr:family 43 glycosylhydrolase [Muribaculaceae bacterium]
MTQKSKLTQLVIAGVLILGACGEKSPYIPDEPIVPVTPPTPDEPTPPQVEPPTEGPSNADLDAWGAPSYADYYRNIAGWDQRHNWNLANVHDPSVVKASDGYFYMYQTDASFGNAHDGHGHFHCRRSKDLVNWEYLGATMPTLPEWVIPKLNEIRIEMGVPEKNPKENEFGYWAPVVRKVKDGLYRMYYSIVCPGYIDGENTWGERAFIGLMENSDPANNDGWVDKGYVITNASDKGLNFKVKPDNWGNCYYRYNAIDPTYIITDASEHWLI